MAIKFYHIYSQSNKDTKNKKLKALLLWVAPKCSILTSQFPNRE